MVKIIPRITQQIPRTPRTMPAMAGGARSASPEARVDPEVRVEISEEIAADASAGNPSPGCSI
jgi:hypothetical protein